jgi:dTDP-glucose 4,6-dehydratase
MRELNNLLVTGGAGFIGSNFIRYMLERAEGFSGRVVNLDALTYAGSLLSVADVEGRHGGGRYIFKRGDIRDRRTVEGVFEEYGIDGVAHFAAESHVDRSIAGPEAFISTNVGGTFTLLDVARKAWAGVGGDRVFHQVGTDEVYGSLGAGGYFTEETGYDPRSPYSASKAAGDHLAMAYHHTYGLPVTLSNCSNNYGPYQFPEKFIPLMILNMLEGKELPVYGDGKNVRDWVYVEDHAAAVWLVMREGVAGRRYNIGGENEWENIKLLEELIGIVAGAAGLDAGAVRGRVRYVEDRLGHDRRYAIDCGRIKGELGWEREVSFEEGLRRTVGWYVGNGGWTGEVRKINR